MAEYVRHYGKRQVASYEDFIASKDDNVLLCVNSAVLGVIRQLVKERALWRSTYYKEVRQEDYEIPTPEEFDTIDGLVSEFLDESANMNTCEEMLLALQDVATAIRTTACCGPNTAGLQDIGGEVYFGSEAPLDEPTTFGTGEEFETEQAYLDHKCRAANAIIYGLIYSLNSLSVTELASLTLASAVLGAAIGFGLFNPPAALILALVGVGVAITALYAISQALDENREDLVCILYSSDTAISAYDDMKDFVEGLAVDLGFVEIEIGAIMDIVMSMAPIDTMNKLYTNIGLPEVPSGEILCSNCGDCQPTMFYGSGPLETGGTFYSEFVPSVDFHILAFNIGVNKSVTFGTFTGWTLQAGSNNDFRVGNAPAAPTCTGNDKAIWNSNTPISGTYCCGIMIFESSTPFSVSITYGANC